MKKIATNNYFVVNKENKNKNKKQKQKNKSDINNKLQ